MERTPVNVIIGSPVAPVNVASGKQTNSISMTIGRKTQSIAPVNTSNVDVCCDKQVREVVVTMQTAAFTKAKSLRTPRKIELVGAVTGSTMFDGSKDVVINTVLNPDECISGRILTTDDYASNSDIDELFG